MGEEILLSSKALVGVPPAALWAFLADTERLNRAIGLAAVSFVPLPDPSRKGHYRAETRVLGMRLRYDELPFDFVEGRYYEVERRFDSGPLERAVVGVRTEPHVSGCELELYGRVLPRNWLGKVVAHQVLGKKMTADVLAFVRAFEKEGAPPAAARPGPTEFHADVLDARLARLTGTERLRRHLAEGSDLDVIRMRPFEQADNWGQDRLEVLTLFLRAAKAGVLDLVWSVLCPHCRVSTREAGSLSQVKAQARCDTCGVDFAADFSKTMEARFTVNGAVRAARKEIYCIGGPANMPGQVAQLRVPSGERREAFTPGPGRLRIRSYSAGGIVTLPSGGMEITLEDGVLTAEARPGSELLIRNRLGGEALVVVERESWAERAATASFVTSLQEFRDLFPGEAVAAGEELSIGSMALLFTDLKGSTELYERLGDGRAFEFVQGHFRYLVGSVARHRGGVVKTMGDAIMAVFSGAADAVQAALEMQRGWELFRKGREGVEDVLLKVGVHVGPAIAIRNEGRLDYFGTTVNTAARAQGLAAGGEIVLTRSLAEDPGARRLLAETGGRQEVFRAAMKGLAGEQELVRVIL